MESGAEELRDVETRIAEAWGRRAERERLDRRAQQIATELTTTRRSLDDATAALEGAEDDMSALDEISFSRLVHTITGSRDSADARRRAEAASALARHHELGVRVAGLERDLAATRERANAVTGAPNELDLLLDRKEALLKATGDPASAAMDEIQTGARGVATQRREIEEAHHASGAAIRTLDSLLDRLESARGWGTYDTFFGGGLISSAIKHDRLDDANDLASEAQAALGRFGRELSDVRSESAPTIEISNFLRFTDVWFDNFFSDLTVQSRIKDALRQADSVRASVVEARAHLAGALERTDRELETLAAERRKLLIGTESGQ